MTAVFDALLRETARTVERQCPAVLGHTDHGAIVGCTSPLGHTGWHACPVPAGRVEISTDADVIVISRHCVEWADL